MVVDYFSQMVLDMKGTVSITVHINLNVYGIS